MPRFHWEAFEHVTPHGFVPDLVKAPLPVAAETLVAMRDYRKDERIKACGKDPLQIFLAYAQDDHIYSDNGMIMHVGEKVYATTTREQRVNKFGLAYRKDAEFYLHRTLADIVVATAIYLFQSQGWSTVLYDGLRTVEGAFNLCNLATDTDMASGLLALPGQSAHNKGLAVDSMMVDAGGQEVDMGGHFDHLDMTTNSRLYSGNAISEAAKKNRLIREAAFLRGAFSQNLLIAPLRPEFWDDRLPENRSDLWRVLDSAARCIGLTLLSAEDEALRKTNRAAFAVKWEDWSYDDFLSYWQTFFKDHETQLHAALGTLLPPKQERPEFYHGNYIAIYDRYLKSSGKNLT